MSDGIKRYGLNVTLTCPHMALFTEGAFVLHADHLASHRVDEAVERAAFEVEYPDLTKTRSVGAPDVYWSAMAQNRWTDWLRCAKSRAKRAGVE